MIDQLIARVSRLGDWSYLIFFLGAALECSAFLGLLVPGESLALAGGFLVSLGLLDMSDLIVVVAMGAVVGDSIGYELGRRLGRPWLIRHGGRVGVRPAHLDRAEAFFARHGGKTVFLGRFVGFLRALSPFVAGSSRMRYRQFLLFNVLGGILWASICVLLGYFLGQSWQIAEHYVIVSTDEHRTRQRRPTMNDGMTGLFFGFAFAPCCKPFHRECTQKEVRHNHLELLVAIEGR